MKNQRTVDYVDVLKALDTVRGLDFIQLVQDFDERGERAWNLLREGRVKRYRFTPSGKVVWIVVGKGGDYLIYPEVGFCGCEDYYFSVMEGEALACQHLIAQKLAQKLDWFDAMDEGDDLYNQLMEKWRSPKQAHAEKLVLEGREWNEIP